MSAKYSSYDQVPVYRKQWFFWVVYLIPFVSIVAIGILLFGDVYYEKKGEVKSFGIANRVVAGLVGAYYVARLVEGLSGG